MNIDRYSKRSHAGISCECQFYRFNFASRHTRLLESQSQNQSVVAVVKFVRSPGENNKRAICKRVSVGEEGRKAGDRVRERKIERASGAEGGIVYIFQIEMLTQ